MALKLGILWMASALAILGCGATGPVGDSVNADAKDMPAGEGEKKPAPEEAKEEITEREATELSWAYRTREMGKEIKAQVKRCQEYATDRLSPPSASKIMPSVSLRDFRSHCEVLTTHYDRQKELYWGSHYSVDSLLGNLARYKDAYEGLLPVWKEGKPSVRLQEELQGMVNAMRTLSRSAGLVGGMDLSAEPMQTAPKDALSKGKMRAEVTRIVRQADGPDLEKLADKLDAFAVGPLKDGGRVAVYSLEHTAEMFRRRLKNRRLRWMGMRSDSEKYDQAFRAVVGNYLDACDALVQSFETATGDLRKGNATLRDGKASMKQVKKALTTWKTIKKAFTEELGQVTG